MQTFHSRAAVGIHIKYLWTLILPPPFTTNYYRGLSIEGIDFVTTLAVWSIFYGIRKILSPNTFAQLCIHYIIHHCELILAFRNFSLNIWVDHIVKLNSTIGKLQPLSFPKVFLDLRSLLLNCQIDFEWETFLSVGDTLAKFNSVSCVH